MATHNPSIKRVKGGMNITHMLLQMHKGMDLFQALCELIANCIDNDGTNISFKIYYDKKLIYLIDNASGMDETDIENKFLIIYNNNHSDDEQSIGIFGTGAKTALIKLYLEHKNQFINESECLQKNIEIYTSKIKPLKLTIPIYELLEGSVQWESECFGIEDMNKNDFDEFNALKMKANITTPTGTIIKLPYSQTLDDILIRNFNLDERKKLEPMQRFDFIFTNIINLSLNDEDGKHYSIQKPHDNIDYRDRTDKREFYYKKTDIIECYKLKNDNQYRFVWAKQVNDDDDEHDEEIIYYEVASIKGGKTSRNMKEIDKNELQQFKKIGDYRVINALPRDDDLLNTEKTNFNTHDKIKNRYGPYNVDFIDYTSNKNDWDQHQSKVALTRNGQRVHYLNLENFKANNARASTNEFIKTVRFCTEVRYYTGSNHNDFDERIPIEGNKLRMNEKNIPLSLTRLIGCIKQDRWEYIKTNIFDKTFEKNRFIKGGNLLLKIEIKLYFEILKKIYQEETSKKNSEESDEECNEESDEECNEESDEESNEESHEETIEDLEGKNKKKCNEISIVKHKKDVQDKEIVEPIKEPVEQIEEPVEQPVEQIEELDEQIEEPVVQPVEQIEDPVEQIEEPVKLSKDDLTILEYINTNDKFKKTLLYLANNKKSIINIISNDILLSMLFDSNLDTI